MSLIILLFIIFILVILVHILNERYNGNCNKKYEEILENKIEHLLMTDSDYSSCEVGCLIACSNRQHILQKECYCPCVDQCWNY